MAFPLNIAFNQVDPKNRPLIFNKDGFNTNVLPLMKDTAPGGYCNIKLSIRVPSVEVDETI